MGMGDGGAASGFNSVEMAKLRSKNRATGLAAPVAETTGFGRVLGNWALILAGAALVAVVFQNVVASLLIALTLVGIAVFQIVRWYRSRRAAGDAATDA